MSGTVEFNITFGLEYNEKWFKRAIEAAALVQDLQNLSNG